MRKILLIFAICFSFFSKASADDTTKLTIKIDHHEVRDQLKLSFMTRMTGMLPYFCEDSLDFVAVFKGEISQECESKFQAMQNLSGFLTNVEYSRFEIVEGVTDHGDRLILVEIYKFEDSEKVKIDLFFILQDGMKIKRIVIE